MQQCSDLYRSCFVHKLCVWEFNVTYLSPSSADSNALILLTVQDDNDQPPVFSETTYNFQVPEDTPINTRFEMITASDRDTPPYARIVYSSTLVSKFKVQILFEGTKVKNVRIVIMILFTFCTAQNVQPIIFYFRINAKFLPCKNNSLLPSW